MPLNRFSPENCADRWRKAPNMKLAARNTTTLILFSFTRQRRTKDNSGKPWRPLRNRWCSSLLLFSHWQQLCWECQLLPQSTVTSLEEFHLLSTSLNLKTTAMNQTQPCSSSNIGWLIITIRQE